MEEFKTLIVVTLSALAAFLAPVSGVIYSVILVGMLNFAVGLYVALKVMREAFSFKKAWECIKEAAIFFVTIACALFVGQHINTPDGAIHAILTVTFALLYFYSVNIFKNLKRWNPESRWIAFVYFIISIEFVKKVPFMETFQKKKKEVGDGEY
jgi:multisubunit Na+/H+ antiporter MnhB subunit